MCGGARDGWFCRELVSEAFVSAGFDFSGWGWAGLWWLCEGNGLVDDDVGFHGEGGEGL